MSLLAPSGKNAKIAPLLRHGGYSRSVTMPAAARLTINWHQAAAKGRKGMLVAKLSVGIAGGRVVTIRVTLTKQGRLLLAQGKRLRIAADGSVQIVGIAPVTAARLVVVSTTGH